MGARVINITSLQSQSSDVQKDGEITKYGTMDSKNSIVQQYPQGMKDTIYGYKFQPTIETLIEVFVDIFRRRKPSPCFELSEYQ